ncbi:MAG: ATP-binding protein [Verrucomicrobiales bacterium]|nr:ATP-binding protein [Verrucomicrobiales bacterium]
MRNITGTPVENDDFFDRPRDLDRLQRDLANGENLLLTAPRRVGKTSLVLRLCELERQAGRAAVYMNVEGCHDELAFAEKIVDTLNGNGLHPELLGRISLVFRRVREAFRGMKMGAAGVDMEMGAAEDPDHSTLGRTLESIFRKIESEENPVLLAIDEMPELLLALGKQDRGAERISHLLHWLRSLRQTYRKHVRWIFLGSIGLDSFVDDRQLGKTINDLTSVSLEALSTGEADAFLTRLAEGNGLALGVDERAGIVRRLGWPLPHHLQMVIHSLIDRGVQTVDGPALDAAFEDMLKPTNLSQFDTWRQRLVEQFGKSDADAARDILRHLCQHPEGRGRDQILNALMSTRPSADPDAVEDQLSRLLQVLLRDGYLLERHGSYAFRSFLLREYWHRREVR